MTKCVKSEKARKKKAREKARLSRLLARKEKLLAHLREKTYCELRSSARHGVGVQAVVPIPAGVNPFETNGLPSKKTINLTDDEVDGLPLHVQDMIRSFILVDKNGLYPVRQIFPR